MELVLVRMSPTPAAWPRRLSPQIVADILWAAAIPDDRLERTTARTASVSDSITVALFIRKGTRSAADKALDLCLRAIRGSPALAGWTADRLDPADLLPLAASIAGNDK
jgi:hypothetical protein